MRNIQRVEVGQRFGRLVTVRRMPQMRQIPARWVCNCDCGREYVLRETALTYAGTKSCGCLVREKAKVTHTKHGAIKTAEYKIWLSMRDRCNNPKNKKYHRYGGRGIKVCERWNDFTAFLLDMGCKPSNDRSIDRIDNDGGYEPSNCRWATTKEQANNTVTNRKLTLNGQTMNLSQWAETLGINKKTLDRRLRSGWSEEEVLTVPAKARALP